MKDLYLEYLKMKNKKILIMISAFLIVEMFLAFFSINRSRINNPSDPVWESMIYTVSSINGFFMPILTAIVVSRICDVEHKGDTWKVLLTTNTNTKKIFRAKFLLTSMLMFIVFIIQSLLIIVYGSVYGKIGTYPVGIVLSFLFSALITTLCIITIQQWVSLLIKNQVFALSLGMIGGFIGIAAPLFPPVISNIFVWAYYLQLSPVTFVFGETNNYYTERIELAQIGYILVLTLTFYLLGKRHLAKQEF